MQEKSSNDHNDQSVSSTASGRSYRFWKYLLLVLSLGAVGLLFFIGSKVVVFAEQVKQLQSDVHVLSLNQVKAGMTTEQRLSELAQSLWQQQNRLADTQSQLKTLISHTPLAEINALKLQEIQYAIRLAQIELLIKHNLPSALVLLKQADAQTVSLSASNAFGGKLSDFHALLIKNIGVLQSANLVDKESLLEKLDLLKADVAGLSILVSPNPNTSLLKNTPHQAHKRWYQRAWDNVKVSFNALIIVRHQEDKIPALMSPEEKIYLQENLQLLLVRAQWALINHEPGVYDKSLNQAKSWVQKYYVQNSLSTVNFLKNLDFLLRQNISPVEPDLSSLLTALPKEI